MIQESTKVPTKLPESGQIEIRATGSKSNTPVDGAQLYESAHRFGEYIKTIADLLLAPTLDALMLWLSLNKRYITVTMTVLCTAAFLGGGVGLITKVITPPLFVLGFLLVDRMIAKPETTKKGRDALGGKIKQHFYPSRKD
jgi:hypothetical protein